MFFKEIVAAISFFFRLRALCFFHGLSDLVKGLLFKIDFYNAPGIC
jgi:hypothetical protein